MAPRSIWRSISASPRVTVGVIRGAHGLRGELRVAPETDNPDRFSVGRGVEIEGLGEREIVSVRGAKGELIVKFAGLDDRAAAEALRGRELRAPIEDARRETPGYLWADLIGMAAVDERGANLGVVSDVLRPGGATDVFVIRTPAGGELLLPSIDSVVLAIDVGARRIIVRPQES